MSAIKEAPSEDEDSLIAVSYEPSSSGDLQERLLSLDAKLIKKPVYSEEEVGSFEMHATETLESNRN